MSLSGLFLCIFLLVHVSGNLQLFNNDGGESFNVYTKFMTSNPLIKAISYITYLTFIVHAVYALLLTLLNQKARKSKYADNRPSANSSWSSRNMGILGTLILIFLVIHMRTFWYEMHFGNIPMVTIDGEEVKNLYVIVQEAFAQPWYVALYVISMIGLAFHLYHGFKSAFQTLGFNHSKYNPLIKSIGYIFAFIIPALFAAMPVYFLLFNS